MHILIRSTTKFMREHLLIIIVLVCLVVIKFTVVPKYGLHIPSNPGIDWIDRIEVASGDAYQGPWRMNDSEFHYVDDPAITLLNDGSWGIVWADQKKQDLFYRQYNSDGEPALDAAVNVSQSPGIFSWLPRMIIDPKDSNRIYILWQDIAFTGGSHGGEIMFSRSVDRGETFSEPVNLSNTKAGAGKGRLTSTRWDNGSLDLAINPNGILFAAWTEYEGALWFSRSSDGGQSFSSPIHIAGESEVPARGPSLATDNQGTVHLAWTYGEDNSADIHYTYSVNWGMSFAEPQLISESGAHSDAPKIAADGNGIVHVVYAEGDGILSSRYEIYYSRIQRADRRFMEPRVVSSFHSGQIRSAAFPDIAINANGSIYLVWELYPDRGQHSRGLGYAYSFDGGRSFSNPGLIPGSSDPAYGVNGSRQGSLMSKLSVNDSGSIVVANSTFKNEESSHIWIFRGESNPD
ncbi:hypothetical protein BH23BAC3_BH23BAC3_32580 [soil metagenome]